MCPLMLVLFDGVLFIMFLVGAATAAAAEPDAARDVAAGKGDTWACRGHAIFVERSSNLGQVLFPLAISSTGLGSKAQDALLMGCVG